MSQSRRSCCSSLWRDMAARSAPSRTRRASASSIYAGISYKNTCYVYSGAWGHFRCAGGGVGAKQECVHARGAPVSYTHLTLPTICSV
eukprot:1181173-Alexandrium_andersonii.AAC.1